TKPWRYERDPTRRLFNRFERLLSRQGVVRHKGEGARAFAARAAQRLPQHAEQLIEFAHAYERQRYGGQEPDASALRESLARLRKQLPWKPFGKSHSVQE